MGSTHGITPLFSLGSIVATPAALEVMERLGINPTALITRHATGDWGDIDPEDRGLNEHALLDGSRVFSVYGERGSDDCLWVITDAVIDAAGHRQATTILRPDDY